MHSRRVGNKVVTRVIPSLIGDAATQPPPDLPSFLFKERIVYLGMTLVPSVTELLVAQFLYLQFEEVLDARAQGRVANIRLIRPVLCHGSRVERVVVKQTRRLGCIRFICFGRHVRDRA